VEIGEELGLGVAADREERASVCPEIVEPLHEPGRRPAEHLLGGVLDVGSAGARVGGVDVDVRGSGRVGLLCARAGAGRGVDKSAHREALAGLEVQSDLDGEARIGGEHFLGLHSCSLRRAPTDSVTTLRGMGRLSLAGLAVVVLTVLAGCGGKTTYSLDKTKS